MTWTLYGQTSSTFHRLRGVQNNFTKKVIVMISGSVHEVDGYSEEILKESVNEFHEKMTVNVDVT